MSCQTRGRTVAIAHRGAHNAWIPENSLQAVREALGLGADWVEFDVWNDAQGKLVVTHDLYPNGKEPPRPYPPVEPFLELVASSDMGLNFDWKGFGAERHVARLLRSFDLTCRTVVSSGSPEVLLRLKHHDPAITTGLSISASPSRLRRLLAEVPGLRRVPLWYLLAGTSPLRSWLVDQLDLLLEVSQVDAIMLHYPLASATVVQAIRDRHKGVYLWTARDVETFHSLLPLQPDGIAMDDMWTLLGAQATREISPNPLGLAIEPHP